MRKISVFISLLVVVSLVFSACTTTGAETSAPASQAASQAASPAASQAASEGAKDKFEIVMIAKTEGLQWFDCMREGLDRFASEHPDIKASMSAPEGADAAKQVAMVEDFIAKGVDAIIIIAIDPDSLVSVVKKAKDAGIADLDVEGASFADRGEVMAEAFAKAMGGKGKYVGCVGALTMVTHVQMFESGVAYLKKNYPEMECLNEEPYEAGIDAQKAYQTFKEVVNAYPDLNGYFSCVTEGSLGACRYLEETNNRKIIAGGGGTPLAIKDYIMNDWLAFGCSSNPIEQGYAVVSATYKILKGEKIHDGIDLGNPYFEKCTYDSKINKLVGNGTVIYTKKNIGDFNY